MCKKNVDIVYAVASKLGSIGIGTIAYHAIKKVNDSPNLSYNIFCRGYDNKLDLKSKSIKSYGYLETISLPLRFLEKSLGLTLNPFKYINYFFGKLINKNLPNCKIYHTWVGFAPEAIMNAKKNGATLILEGANSHPLNYSKILNKEYNKLGLKEFLIDPNSWEKQSEILKEFDYVTCTSDFVYNSFLERGFSKKQLIKMPYGVELKNFKVKNHVNKKLKFVFIGSIQVRKGIYYLLKAWDELKLKDAELIIVGRVWADAKKIVDKYKDNNTIKFVGFESNPQKYLESSDVFVFPTLEEGSALVTYEAMASGLPLITTFNSGTIARDKKEALIVPAGNVEALKEKIKYLYDNPKIISKMGKDARKRVEQFSWKDYGERIAKFYEEILNKK